jgi:NAD-dependent dihydropyrimidine dehydrogenase PreA subunit
MPYVIAEPCQSTCDTACADVCPVDAIHGPRSIQEIRDLSASARAAERPRLQLYIDPEICICCASCEPVCPVDAIFEEDDLPAAWQEFRAINARHFR